MKPRFDVRDYDQFNAFLRHRVRCGLAGVALIDKCHFDSAAGDRLHFLGESAHHRTLLFVGRIDMHRQQISQICTFEPFFSL
jgi:hypothetical protein